MRNTKFGGIVMALVFVSVAAAQGYDFLSDFDWHHQQAVESLVDAANGQPICDLKALQEQPHCVPGPIRRILEGKDWHLVQNFSPVGVEVACLGGSPGACYLVKLAREAVSRQTLAQECRDKYPGKRHPAACRNAEKDQRQAVLASVTATNAAIIRPDGCCGTVMESSSESGQLAQFLLGFANQLNQMRNSCEASASARFHYGTAPWHQAFVYCLTH